MRNVIQDFNDHQIDMLELCKKQGIDISSYVDAAYTPGQMWQIKIGLEKNLDLSIYNKLEYDYYTMKQIREALEKNLDVVSIIKESPSTVQLNLILDGMLNGIDTKRYANSMFSIEQMEEIRKGVIQGIDISDYIVAGFSHFQLVEIKKGLEKGLDVKMYEDIHFTPEQMRIIREGLLMSLDVSVFADIRFTSEQMEIIREGLSMSLDVSLYLNPELDDLQMEQIFLGLVDHIDPSHYINKNLPPEIMKWLRIQITHGRPVSENLILACLYFNYNLSQLIIINKGMQNGIDYKVYSNPRIPSDTMDAILWGLKQKFIIHKEICDFYSSDISELEEIKFKWAPNPSIEYNLLQIKILSQVMACGFDMKKFSKEYLEASEMQELFNEMSLEGSYGGDFSLYDKSDLLYMDIVYGNDLVTAHRESTIKITESPEENESEISEQFERFSENNCYTNEEINAYNDSEECDTYFSAWALENYNYLLNDEPE